MAKRADAATASPPAAPSTAAGIGLHGSLLYLAAALVTLVLAIPFNSTVVEQLASATPRPAPEGAYDRIREAIRRERPLAALYHAQLALQRRMPQRTVETRLDEAINIDPANGLFDLLKLLVALRANPTDAQQIESALANLRHARPASLHGVQLRTMLLKAFAAGGLGERQAAAEAQRMSNDVLTRYIAALRELGGRIATLDPPQADEARAALARAWSELVADSPLDVVALAASDQIPQLVSGGQAADIARFREDWHRRVDPDRITVVPWPGGGAADLARDRHDAMLAAMVSALASAATAAVLLAIAIVSLLAVLTTGSRRSPWPTWRIAAARPAAREGLAWAAALVALLPLLAGLIWLRIADLPFTWLLSARSLPAVMLSPFLTCVAVGLGVYIFTGWPTSHARARLSTRTAVIIAVGFLLLFSLAAVLLRSGHESWGPPENVRRFRQFGQLAGLTAVLAWIVWTIAGWRARRRAGVRRGAQSRAVLAIASRALLACSILTLVLLALNARRDAEYQRAYAAAVLDPITDRLGPGWNQKYFHLPAVQPD